MANIFGAIPNELPEEVTEVIYKNSNVKIERIISDGHKSDEDFWYDQEQSEWILVLQGQGVVEFEDGHSKVLDQGDYLLIRPHQKHRVSQTSSEQKTIWLAIFFD